MSRTPLARVVGSLITAGSLLGAVEVRSQVFPITTPSITTCAGALVDSGGEGGPGYGNNDDFTTVICPDQPGTAISLQAVIFNLSSAGQAPFDVFTVYDGNSTAAPVLGSFDGSSMPPILSGSFDNPTGCLTVHFTSNATGTGAFAFVISCEVPCDPPQAAATMGQSVPALVCQNEMISFNGSGSTAAPGRTIVAYHWDFDDGTPVDSTSGPVVQHAFPAPGEYVVQLTVVDDIGCTNPNLVDLQVLVSTTPRFNAFASELVICQGETVTLNATGITPTTWSAMPIADFGDGFALPDDIGTPFTSGITFTGFTPGQTLTDISQFTSICVSMEHSFMGDFVLSITSPSGQTVVLHQQGGGGTFLGDANDADGFDPVVGTCWDYCFSPNATLGTWAACSAAGATPNVMQASQGTALVPGTYSSVQNLSGLIGSPLNGTWTLTFTDLWAADNGFICSWGLNFDPSLYPDLVEFTPVLGTTTPDSSWWSGPAELVLSPSQPLVATATPVDPGPAVYTFSVIDNFGCTYDTTITVYVNDSPDFAPVILGDSVVCDNDGVLLSVQGTYAQYNWSNGFNGPTILVAEGTYTVTAGEGDCLLTSPPFTVSPAPTPTPVIDGILFNCLGQPTELSTLEPYSTYSWSNGGTTPTVLVGTGTYSVTVANEDGCEGVSAPVTVLAADSPEAVFTSNSSNPIMAGDSVLFTHVPGDVPVVSWAWTIDSSDVLATGPVYEPYFAYPGVYLVTLTVTTADGCTAVWTYEQMVSPQNITVPNVFSPNGDGHNDRLVFEGVQFHNGAALQVFNRWGQAIYENSNYKNTWTANDVPAGTYFFVLKMPSGEEHKGHVTLLR